MQRKRLAGGVLACACASYIPSSEAFCSVKSLVRDIPPHRLRHHDPTRTSPPGLPGSRSPPRRAHEDGGRTEKGLLLTTGNAEISREEGSSPAGDGDGEEEEQLLSRAGASPDGNNSPLLFDSLSDKGGVSKDRLAFEELGTREVDRLFSTLEPCDVSGFRRKPSNVLSAAALIGGTAVGAGILALPAATLQAGVLPSSVGLVMM